MAERTPDEDAREQAAEQARPGLGFRELSMNVIPASATEEESEAPRRAGRLAFVIVLVLVAAAVLFIGGRLISNLAPGQEAQERLRERVAALPAWQDGTIMDVRYLAGDRVRVEFSARVSTSRKEAREAVRQAARSVMEILMEERPGRDLYMEGHRGEEQILRAVYRAKSTLLGPDGEPINDIVVRVEGDPEGGIGEAYEQGRPAAE